MADEWLWITEADVVSMIDMGDAIRAVRAGLLDEARGSAQNMVKTVTKWDGGTLHAIGAAFTGEEVVGTKTWAHTTGGATPLLIMFDSATGAILAIIEAFALGQLRTGAVSGVMTDALSARDAHVLAMVGTGKQALPQAAAVSAVRPIEQVRIYGPDEGRRKDFCTLVEQTLAIEAVPCDSVADAVDGAPIVTLATRATEPFLEPAMVAPGAHVNALGAITPERQEFQADLLDRCSVIATDSIEASRGLSREFQTYFGDDEAAWSRVETFADVVSAPRQRPDGADVTLAKAMGTGVCDVAVGLACYRAMTQNQIGRRMEPSAPLTPRLRARSDVTGIGYV